MSNEECHSSLLIAHSLLFIIHCCSPTPRARGRGAFDTDCFHSPGDLPSPLLPWLYSPTFLCSVLRLMPSRAAALTCTWSYSSSTCSISSRSTPPTRCSYSLPSSAGTL